MAIGITRVAYAVPSQRLTHDELAARFGAEQMEKVAQSTGIWERRVAPPGMCASDLAAHAARTLFEEGGIDPASIDLLIFATQTPDYLLPSTACILQNRLRVPTTAAAFDINLGCSQYVYSLGVATGMLSAKMANRALVLTGDTVSRILNPGDRAVVPLFGDAGTATILEPVRDGAGFLAFDFGTDGAGAEALIWPASGLRLRHSPETAVEKADKTGSIRSQNDMYMDGAAVFMFTMRTIPQTVARTLEKAGVTINDVDLFVFHQASQFIVDTAVRRLKIPREKVHMKLADLGNSGGSTVGVCLADAVRSGVLKPGMRVLLSAFGVGLSWASAYCVWDDATAFALELVFEAVSASTTESGTQ
ncbi:MAG TPA: ketoacyl-ACP synthase III [Reyranella sp.]|nr:ketoacyl-ACP synthase III [Reyranella sp.]